jgi:hypothetical protein
VKAIVGGVTVLCPACSHPGRRHDGDGCQIRDCWCTIQGGTDAPVAPPSVAASPGPVPAPPPAVAAAAAGVVDEAARRSGAALKTPRRTTPRPAVPVALVDPAVVGEGDAEVAPGLLGAGPAAALTFLSAFVDQLFATAYFVAARWYCPSCHDWPLQPGACRVCQAPLQAVYLATVPREI